MGDTEGKSMQKKKSENSSLEAWWWCHWDLESTDWTDFAD